MTGLEAELHFWRVYLPKRRRKHLRRSQLAGYLVDLIGDRKEVDILDVGSGPVSTIGYVMKGVEVNLVLTDILADEYAELLEELGLTPRIKVQKQDMARLTYDDNSFDIVNCRNALDHTENPFEAIREMARVCKVGGWIYLWHFAHMAYISRHRGLHQWNIDSEVSYKKFLRGDSPVKGDDCLFWSKEDRFLLSECVEGFVTKDVLTASRKRHIVISKKRKE